MGECKQLVGVKTQESLDQGCKVYLLQALSARVSASALNPGRSHQPGELPAQRWPGHGVHDGETLATEATASLSGYRQDAARTLEAEQRRRADISIAFPEDGA